MKQSFRLAAALLVTAVTATLAAFPIDNRVYPDGTPVLIPAVQQYKAGEGKLSLPAEFTVSAPAEAANEVEVLAAIVKQYFPDRLYKQVDEKAPLPKVAAGGFSMDRKNDGKGNLSVATRRVTTENAPLPGFCETRKDAPGVLAEAPQNAFCRLELTRDGVPPQPEGYTLAIGENGITIKARDVRGLYYGVQTLHNLLRNALKPELPRCTITDWPALRERGIYMDWRTRGFPGTDKNAVSEEKRLAIRRQLVREIEGLGAFKYNIMLIEFSETFPYRDNPFTKRKHSFTIEDLEAVRDAARRHHIKLVPHIQILSHDNWLQAHPRYWEDIAEGKPGNPWSSASCPLRPLPRKLNKMAIREQIEFFKPERVDIAFDEVEQGPWGVCPLCRKRSRSELLRDAVIEYTEEVLKYGVVPMLYFDEFFPGAPYKGYDILPYLDKRVNICNWDYSEYLRCNRFEHLKTTGLRIVGMSYGKRPNNLRLIPRELLKHNLDCSIATSWGGLRDPSVPKGGTHDGRASYVNGGNYNWNPDAPAPTAQTFDPSWESMRLIAPETIIASPELRYTPVPIDGAFNARLGADPFFPMLDGATAAKVKKELAALPEKFDLAAEADGTCFAVVVGTTPQEPRAVTVPLRGLRAEVLSLLCFAAAPRHPRSAEWRYRIAEVEFRYEDGTAVSKQLQRHVDIMEWNAVASSGFNNRFVNRFNDKRGALAAFFASDLANPHPQKPLKEIVWKAAEKEYGFSVALFAISAANRGKAPVVTAKSGKTDPASRMPKPTPPPPQPEKVSVLSPDSVTVCDFGNGLPKGTKVSFSGLPADGEKFSYRVVSAPDAVTPGAKVLEMKLPAAKPGLRVWPCLIVDIPVDGKMLAEKKVQSLFFDAQFTDLPVLHFATVYLVGRSGGAKKWITFNAGRFDTHWHRFAIPIDKMGKERGDTPIEEVTHFRFRIFFSSLMYATTVRLGPVGLSPRRVEAPPPLRIEKVADSPQEEIPFRTMLDL